MKRTVILVFFLIIAFESSIIMAQVKKDDRKKEGLSKRLVFGGMVGLQFGTITSIEISPIVGYYLFPRLLASLGLSYQYYRESYYNSFFSSNIYGIRTAMSYTVIDNIGKNLAIKSNFGIYTHLEYELLNLDRDLSNEVTHEKVKRFWLPGVIIGIGIRQPFGKNNSFSIALLYNIIANSKTPYDNPFLRIGFFF